MSGERVRRSTAAHAGSPRSSSILDAKRRAWSNRREGLSPNREVQLSGEHREEWEWRVTSVSGLRGDRKPMRR
jgi:hypothetical protein